MPSTVETVTEVRARVSRSELKRGVFCVPTEDTVVIFDSECTASYSYNRFRVVPLPEHKIDGLADGNVYVWDLIDDTPDVRLKAENSGAPAAWS